MAEQGQLFTDIKPNSSAPADDRKPLWTRSDNAFRFNFLSDSCAAPQEKTSPPDGRSEPGVTPTAFTGQGTAFAFNFQIPPAPPGDNTEMMDVSSTASQQCVQEEKAPLQAEGNAPAEPSKAKKKKKKSGKKSPSSSTEAQQTPGSAEGSQGAEDAELSAEEQLNRQLDWCIEQLEGGMRAQKATPKQKEEASRALKTLKSSKAPLAKKRQVMRAMTGDYRKKMDEEKTKQYKLIQSEMASSHVKVVSDSPKKSVFHRRAEVKTGEPAATEKLHQDAAQNSDLNAESQKETSGFVFTPSKEEFTFNFF